MDKYYIDIKNNLINNEIYCKIKDYSKEKHRIITYFKTGKLLYENGRHWRPNNFVMEYCSDPRILSREYQII